MTWSALGQRATYGNVLYELAKEYPDFFVMSADVAVSSGLRRLMEEMPERFLSVGIAEQNLVTVASGIAREGIKTFVSSYATFMSMRCYEQLRVDGAYMNNNIRAVGIASGVSLAYQGNTHFGLEDAGIMRCIPGMTVVEPADCLEVYKTVEAAMTYEGPMYIRLTGVTKMPVVYKADFDFEIGKGIKLQDGSDVLIVATGSMVYRALKAATMMQEEGVSCSVIDMHTIKPIDSELLLKEAAGKKLVVTAEEHVTIGGLSSAVAEVLSCQPVGVKQVMVGFPNEFLKSGAYETLMSHYGLDAEGICNKIKSNL